MKIPTISEIMNTRETIIIDHPGAYEIMKDCKIRNTEFKKGQVLVIYSVEPSMGYVESPSVVGWFRGEFPVELINKWSSIIDKRNGTIRSGYTANPERYKPCPCC